MEVLVLQNPSCSNTPSLRLTDTHESINPFVPVVYIPQAVRNNDNVELSCFVDPVLNSLTFYLDKYIHLYPRSNNLKNC